MNQQPTWHEFPPAGGGYRVVWDEKGERCGFADATGTVIVPVMYTDAHSHIDTTANGFMVKTNKGWGVVDSRNKTIISFDWTHIERASKATHGWDGYRCHSELKKLRYFRYSSEGKYQGNFPIQDLPAPELITSEVVTDPVTPTESPPAHQDKTTYLMQGDTTYTIIEKQGAFALFQNNQPLNWPTNWPDFIRYLQVQETAKTLI